MKIENVEYISGISKNDKLFRSVKLLEALLWGIDVHLGNFSYRLAEVEHDGFRMMASYPDTDFVIGIPEFTIEYLSIMASKMTDEEYEKILFKLASSKSLTEHNCKDYKRKEDYVCIRKH
jgi:hypothetical protein